MTTKTGNLDSYRQIPMTFRLPAKLHEAIKERAREEGVTISKWIRDRLANETGVILLEPIALNSGRLDRSVVLPQSIVEELNKRKEVRDKGVGEFIYGLLNRFVGGGKDDKRRYEEQTE
jgi:hypothetical protein